MSTKFPSDGAMLKAQSELETALGLAAQQIADITTERRAARSESSYPMKLTRRERDQVFAAADARAVKALAAIEAKLKDLADALDRGLSRARIRELGDAADEAARLRASMKLRDLIAGAEDDQACAAALDKAKAEAIRHTDDAMLDVLRWDSAAIVAGRGFSPIHAELVIAPSLVTSLELIADNVEADMRHQFNRVASGFVEARREFTSDAKIIGLPGARDGEVVPVADPVFDVDAVLGSPSDVMG